MMMKFDSNNVKLYMTIIQVYNDTLSHNATIYITINSVMALAAALSGIPAVEWCFNAVSIAIYITINLGSHTCST
jgi:predicted glycosyltransferase